MPQTHSSLSIKLFSPPPPPPPFAPPPQENLIHTYLISSRRAGFFITPNSSSSLFSLSSLQTQCLFAGNRYLDPFPPFPSFRSSDSSFSPPSSFAFRPSPPFAALRRPSPTQTILCFLASHLARLFGHFPISVSAPLPRLITPRFYFANDTIPDCRSLSFETFLLQAHHQLHPGYDTTLLRHSRPLLAWVHVPQSHLQLPSSQGNCCHADFQPLAH